MVNRLSVETASLYNVASTTVFQIVEQKHHKKGKKTDITGGIGSIIAEMPSVANITNIIFYC